MTLRDAVRLLEEAGADDAKNDALTLYAHVSGRSRASLMFSMNDDISAEPCFDEFTALLKRRAAREPLQYIIGKWSFFGDEYFVSPACLIPRPDTETVVEVLLSRLKKGAVIADLCCGSGCIGIAAVRNSDAVCFSVDVSEDALEIAKKNAASLGVGERIRFARCDVLDAQSVNDVFSGKKFDLITSNPPYIKPSDASSLAPELSYEPEIALFGGEDGMLFYRSITENFLPYLASGGAFIYEIGYDEADDIKTIADAASLSCSVVNDIEGRPRAAILTKQQ